MSWNVGIIKKRLKPDSTFLLQDQILTRPQVGDFQVAIGDVVCIPVKKGNTELLNEINLGIIKLRKEETIKKIMDKWSPKRVVFFTRGSIYRLTMIVSILLLLLVISVAIFWVFT